MKQVKYVAVATGLLFALLSAQMSDHNPMTVGSYWIQHTDSMGGYTSSMIIEAIDLINGEEFVRMKQILIPDSSAADSSVWYTWHGQDSTGGLLGAFGSSSDLDSAFIYDPPEVSFPIWATEVGDSWEYEMSGTGAGNQHFSCRIVSLSATAEVPTGVYTDCFQMNTIITWENGDTTQIYDLYHAPGVGQVLNEGWSAFMGDYRFELVEYYVAPATAIPEPSNAPIRYHLAQNYPNPFNPITTISYELPKTSDVILSIYDINGHLVEMLVSQHRNAGMYQVQWDASGYSSGLYFYQIAAGDFTAIRRCVLLK